MGAQWTKQSGSAQIRQRIDSLIQPMPEHEVEQVDFDTRASVGPVSAKAVIALVSVLAVIGGVLFGCSIMGEDAAQPGVNYGNNAGGLPGQAAGSTDESAPSAELADSSASASPTADAQNAPVIVSVQGQVQKPGLLEVPSDTRVGQAIDQAGGIQPEAQVHNVNLAEKVADGMQIMVDDHGSAVTYPGGAAAAGPAVGGAPASGAAGVSSAGGMVNVNTADATVLETLDGVGPSTAQAIISWRDSNGKFTSVEQLMEVRGIGPAKFEAMKAHVTVD